jgi:hypothetical protein
MAGTNLIQSLPNSTTRPVWILMSGFLTVPVIVEAMQMGACDVLEKPCDIDDVAAKITSLLAGFSPRPRRNGAPGASMSAAAGDTPRSVAERWAAFVLQVCEAEGDPKTLVGWSRLIGVSYSSLCETCRILDIRPHDARDFARVLRVVIQGARHRCAPEALLDVSDRRTLSTMLERAGASNLMEFRSYSVAAFLARQTFVPHGSEGLKAVAAMLSRPGAAAEPNDLRSDPRS